MHATGREKFIAFFNSFHGRTLGSLSLTSSKTAQRLGFKRQALDVVHVPYPNEFRNPFRAEDCGDGGAGQGALHWIEERLFKTTTPPQEVAAIVVEAVQGEGGYVPAPKNFLHGLRRICDQHGILLVLDEVQSGMGRTGKMFASDHHELKPDIICLAKGIGSGLPIGATVARAQEMGHPRVQVGLRFTPVEAFDIDVIYGRNITGENANWITLGTTIRFPVPGGKPDHHRTGHL